MTEYDELMRLGETISRRVRCLLIYCARCDLKVLRVERDNRDRGKPSSSMGALFTYGGLHVQADGARDFKEYRDTIDGGRTYTWRCAHGHADSRKLERFLRAWPQHVDGDPTAKPQRIIRLKLGVDV
jgi:hypothetical protein